MEVKFLSNNEINYIRGKMSVGKATIEELQSIFVHLLLLEDKLYECDDNDMFGTEGWRHYFGMPE